MACIVVRAVDAVLRSTVHVCVCAAFRSVCGPADRVSFSRSLLCPVVWCCTPMLARARGIVSGCIGLLAKFNGAAVGTAYLQASGMLFEMCDKVKQLPRTDSIAAKRVVLKVRRQQRFALLPHSWMFVCAVVVKVCMLW